MSDDFDPTPSASIMDVLKTDSQGLVTAVIQHHETGQVHSQIEDSMSAEVTLDVQHHEAIQHHAR